MSESPLDEALKRRLMQSQLTRIDVMERALRSPECLADAKRQPRLFTATFGPIGPQRTRETAVPNVGFISSADLVDTGVYITPNDHNVLVGQNGPFRWCSSAMYAELSWTYASNPGFAAPIVPLAYGGLYSPAIADNGGAMILNNFVNTQQFAGAPVRPRISFDIDLYDKTRGRSVTSSRISPEVFAGLGYGFKELPVPMDFETGTELEPRMYVTECRMTDALDTNTAFDAADVNVFVTMLFKGFMVLP